MSEKMIKGWLIVKIPQVVSDTGVMASLSNIALNSSIVTVIKTCRELMGRKHYVVYDRIEKNHNTYQIFYILKTRCDKEMYGTIHEVCGRLNFCVTCEFEPYPDKESGGNSKK